MTTNLPHRGLCHYVPSYNCSNQDLSCLDQDLEHGQNLSHNLICYSRNSSIASHNAMALVLATAATTLSTSGNNLGLYQLQPCLLLAVTYTTTRLD